MNRPTSHSTPDSGSRDNGSQRTPRRGRPYFLYRGKFKTYDYTHAAATLGHDFVAAACDIVRQQKHEAGVTHRTWVDNYVFRLGELFNALQAFLIDDTASHKDPSQFGTRQWTLFETWLQNHLQSLPLSAKSRAKALNATSNLLRILHRTGVISTPLTLKAPTRRDRAPINHSRFSERGWNRQPAPPHIDTPFKFFVEPHGREYDYTPFRDVGRQFLADTSSILRKTYHAYSANKAKHTHEVWTRVLRYIQSQCKKPASKTFRQALYSGKYRSIGPEAWENILYGWRNELTTQIESGHLKRITAHTCVGRLNLAWASFADAGLVPRVRIRGFKNARSSYLRQSRATLAQLPLRDPISDAAVRSATQHLTALFDASDRDEARQYIRSLSQHLTAQVVSGLPVESLIKEIHTLNTERLLALRRCAERDLRKWHEHWSTGQTVLRNSTIEGTELVGLVDSPQWSASEVRRHSSQLFFHGPKSTRLGHALLYIDARYGGAISGVHGRVHHIARSLGGRPALSAYLNPHTHATLALWVLLLVDTGANCEVARTTPWNCLRPSKDSGWRTLLLGPKLRARGAHILDEIPERNSDESLSLVEAIEMYKLMASRYRALATPSAKNYLFVHEFKGSIDLLKEWTARAWFLEFLKRHPELAQFDARPSMIRPSVLMSIQHRNDNRVEYAQAVGDHKSPSTTSQFYTGRAPIKMAHALKIRRFQNLFESVLIVSIDGAIAKLGLTEEQFADLFSEAKRTGLRVACLNALTTLEPEARSEEQPPPFDQRCGRSMRWVIATVETVADLILFKEQLERSFKAPGRAQTDAFVDKWLSWLIFAEVALQKLRESESAGVYEKAMKLATQRRSSYRRIPLE